MISYAKQYYCYTTELTTKMINFIVIIFKPTIKNFSLELATLFIENLPYSLILLLYILFYSLIIQNFFISFLLSLSLMLLFNTKKKGNMNDK